MPDIERVLNRDRLLRALTGLNRKAFEELLVAFSPLYEQARQRQPRQRAVEDAKLVYWAPKRSRGWPQFGSESTRYNQLPIKINADQ